MSEQPPPQRPTFGAWMGSMWLYTLLRFGLWALLWWVMVLLGLGGFLALALSLALSIPLSYVLLVRPRARLARTVEERVNAHRVRRAEFDQQLDPEHHDD